MATPLNYTEIVHNIDERLSRIEKMVIAIYKDEPPVAEIQDNYNPGPRTNNTNNSRPKINKPREEMTADEEVLSYGQQIPYNLLDEPNEVVQFQQFLWDCKNKYKHKLHDRELEMVDYADKGFADVRLSDRHLATMKKIYLKIIGKEWPYHTKAGFMYKLDDYQPVWSWE